MLIVALDVVKETALTLGHLLKASTSTKNNGCSTLHNQHGLFPMGHLEVAKNEVILLWALP